MARPNCLRLFVHWARRAASRAAWTAGKSRAIRTAMIAITTSNSISVNPRRFRWNMRPPGLEGSRGDLRIGDNERPLRIEDSPPFPAFLTAWTHLDRSDGGTAGPEIG